jgi:hypothetical protein
MVKDPKPGEGAQEGGDMPPTERPDAKPQTKGPDTGMPEERPNE